MAVNPNLRQFEILVHPTGRVLGQGAYGSVDEVEIPGALCAAKKLHDGLLNIANNEEVRRISDAFVRECGLMSTLRHPHIVQFIGVCYLPGLRLPSLVMERLDSCLHELLETTPNIELSMKLSILVNVAGGLVYLHSQNPPVIHRDLTARNVLLNSAFIAKIADLGVARILDLRGNRLVQTMTTGPGNIVYMPPEAIDDHARYNASIDVFSFGNLALFTFTQEFPQVKAATYTNPSSGAVTARTEIERRSDGIQLLERTLGAQNQCTVLTKSCLHNLPARRPSSSDLLEALKRVRGNAPDLETNEHLLRRNLRSTQVQLQQLRESNASIRAQNEQLNRELQGVRHNHRQQVESSRQQSETASRNLKQQAELLQQQRQQAESLQQQNISLSQQIISLQEQLQKKDSMLKELKKSQVTRELEAQAKERQESEERLKLAEQETTVHKIVNSSQNEASAIVEQPEPSTKKKSRRWKISKPWKKRPLFDSKLHQEDVLNETSDHDLSFRTTTELPFPELLEADRLQPVEIEHFSERFEADRLQPVEIEYFSEHIKNMHKNRDRRFEQEYQSLPNDESVPATAGKKNKSKNRFANIFPYDFTRVKLAVIEGVEDSDYINASYIDGYGRANAYIAAQGPMPNTIGDFWRMIWEHRLSTIVMLTKVTEGGKRKCEQYWPDSVHDTYTPPETTLVVSFEEVQPFADYEIRKLVVTNPSDPQSSPLTISHYHFLGWPDHGVPLFATAFIGFIRRVRSRYNKSGPPMLVHCSAGVGRTGTFIVLDSMLERLEKEKTLNVYEFLTNMRRKRIQMVQTKAQYVFIHDALEETIICGDTAILSHNLHMKIGSLGRIVPRKIITGFQDQFDLLSSVSRQPTDKDHSDALQHYNSAKNRYQDRLPFNTNRARLRPTGTPGADYVNASFIDGYKKRNAYIAAQAPLPNTVNDFWRIIWEFKSKCIVMLCDLIEGVKETCHPYWPTFIDSTTQYGKLLVTLKSEKKDLDKEFIIRKFEITEEKTQSAFGNDKNISCFMVTQFQFIGWPEQGRPDTSQGVLQMVESVNAVQRSSGNKPITVICNDGIGRTGTFICIHAQLERAKTEGVIDIFQFIKSSRISRPNLVSELDYYIYCHYTLADFLDTFDTYANFKDLIL